MFFLCKYCIYELLGEIKQILLLVGMCTALFFQDFFLINGPQTAINLNNEKVSKEMKSKHFFREIIIFHENIFVKNDWLN